MVKCVAVAVLLLALLGVAACRDDESAQVVVVSYLDSIRDPAGVPTRAKVAPEQIAEAKQHGVPVAFENDLGMRFVLIPAGMFEMGSPHAQDGDVERVRHEVTIPTPFYIQITEVTTEQYRRWKRAHVATFFTGASLDHDTMPAVLLTWRDAMAFASWLNGQGGNQTYRLPTEIEWERAARNGMPGLAYPWGDVEKPWLRNATGPDGYERTAPVAQYQPSRYGLYDMAGNVSEWCRDLARVEVVAAEPGLSSPHGPDGPLRVVRGGSWLASEDLVRCTGRFLRREGRRSVMVGFRLVSPLPEPSK